MLTGFSITIFERGAAGIPTTTYVTDLRARVDSYQHTSSYQFGFESMTCSFIATLEEALDWLARGLMRSVVVYGPDGEIVWEGYLNTIEAQFGQERRSLALDGMANRVRVRYTTVLGTPATTSTGGSTASQGIYGVKDSALSLAESDSTEAGHYRDAMLADLAYPVSGPSANVTTGDMGEIRLTLSFVGWYGTLDWVLTSDTSTTKTSTTTQVGTLLSDIAGVNAFISTATTHIVSSGITAVEFIADDTPYRGKIESLLKRGNGTNPYAWGVYEDREFYADVYAGATPTTITYRRPIGTSDVYNNGGALIRPWNVRPNAMYEVTELLDISPVSTAPDTAARFYVARTTCAISGDTVTLTLEPKDSTDLATILVTKYVR